MMIKESKYTECRVYIVANTVTFGYKTAKAKKKGDMVCYTVFMII